jgi:hypothetical protein
LKFRLLLELVLEHRAEEEAEEEEDDGGESTRYGNL